MCLRDKGSWRLGGSLALAGTGSMSVRRALRARAVSGIAAWRAKRRQLSLGSLDFRQ